MSGFTLGTSDGATLGTTDGGTLGQIATKLKAPVQTLGIGHPTPSVTGAGQTAVSSPVQTLGIDHPVPTLKAINTFEAPVQTLGIDHPTGDITGSGQVAIQAPVQTLAFDLPKALIGYADWVIDGDAVADATIAEIAEHDALTLTFRVPTATLTNVLRPLKINEGQVNDLTLDDGSYRGVDRSGGSNTFTVTPPVTRLPLRRTRDYHVDRYEEDMVSRTVEEWDVTLDLMPTETRTDTETVSESVSGGWGFTTRNGTIATDSVDADFLGRGAGGVERFALTARLTKQQAHSFETALALQRGVRVRRLPDTSNEAVDETSGEANTVTVSSPTTAVVPDGDYIVLSWESERLNDAAQSVTFEIVQDF